MPTWGDIADDVLQHSGYNTDDAERDRPGALFSLSMVVNHFKRLRLEKELKSGYGSRGVTDAVTIFDNVKIKTEPRLKDRAYFDLPATVFDLQQNGGFEYITYNTKSGCDNLLGVRFEQTSPGELDMINGSEFQRPSEMYPRFFRARYMNELGTFTDRVWLVGVSPVATSVEIGVYLTAPDIVDPNAQADIPDDMILNVKRHMLEMERWGLLVPQEDKLNDGRGRKLGSEVLQPPVRVSINDPSYQQP